MDERGSQNRDEEVIRENEPELRFEHECPIDEIAQFVSDVRCGEVVRRKRDQLNPEQTAKKIEAYLAKPNVIELILRKGEELAGCAFSYEQFEEELAKEIPIPGINVFSRENERVFCIREVDVKSEHRGQGFGKMIMERIMQEAQQKGATKLLLSVFPDDDNVAYQMYKKLGFVEVSAELEKHNCYYMSYDCAQAEGEKPKDAWNGIFEKDGRVFTEVQENMPMLEKTFEEKGIKKVLDLGCGSGRHSVYLAEHGFEVCGLDASSKGIELANEQLDAKGLKADLKVGDIYEKLPYADSSFEAIVSTQTMHHNTIEKIRELIKEMERVLVAGGTIFITVRKRKETSGLPQENEEKIADRTFIPTSGGEKGLPHYYFDEETLRKEFGNFEISGIWEEAEGRHYCLLGSKKSTKI